MSLIWWAVLCTAVALIGITKSGFGSGVGLLIVPLATVAGAHLPGVGEPAVLGLLLPLLIAGDLVAVWQYRRSFSAAEVRYLLPGTLVGVAAASLFLRWLHGQAVGLTESLIQIEIGIESVSLILLSRLRPAAASGANARAAWRRGSLNGTLAGVSSTLAHAAGPIITLHLLPRDLNRRTFVGTCAVYFMITNLVKVPGYIGGGMLSSTPWLLAASLLPVVAAGGVLGRWMNKRVSEVYFSRVILWATLVTGVYLLGLGITHLVALYRHS